MPNKVGPISLETDLDEFCVCMRKRADPDFPDSDGKICVNLLVYDSGRKGGEPTMSGRALDGPKTGQMQNYISTFSNPYDYWSAKGTTEWQKTKDVRGPAVSRGAFRSLSEKYLPYAKNFSFGIHYDAWNKIYMVGKLPVSFYGDDILIEYDGYTMRYKGTDGLWRLLTQDTTHHGDLRYFEDIDWVVYMEILLRCNQPKKPVSSRFSKYFNPEIAKYNNDSDPAAVGDILGCAGRKIADYLKLKLDEALAYGRTWVDQPINEGNETVRQVANRIYGKIGQLGNSIYHKLNKMLEECSDCKRKPTNDPKKPTNDPTKPKNDPTKPKNDPTKPTNDPTKPTNDPTKPTESDKDRDIYDLLDCRTCQYIKDMDHLLRKLLSLQKLQLGQKMYCGFTQSCLLFWMVQRFVASLGNRGGTELLIDWALINSELIQETLLLRKISFNLPFGYNHKDNPVCGPTPNKANVIKRGSQIDTDCVIHDEIYKAFQRNSRRLETDIRIGITVLQKLFDSDPAFFEKMDVFGKAISTVLLNTAIEKGFRYMQSYYSSP